MFCIRVGRLWLATSQQCNRGEGKQHLILSHSHNQQHELADVCVCVCVGVFVVINCWLCVSAETIYNEGFLVFVLSKEATSNGYKYVSGMRLLLNCGLVQIQLQI